MSATVVEHSAAMKIDAAAAGQSFARRLAREREPRGIATSNISTPANASAIAAKIWNRSSFCEVSSDPKVVAARPSKSSANDASAFSSSASST